MQNRGLKVKLYILCDLSILVKINVVYFDRYPEPAIFIYYTHM